MNVFGLLFLMNVMDILACFPNCESLTTKVPLLTSQWKSYEYFKPSIGESLWNKFGPWKKTYSKGLAFFESVEIV